MAIAEKIGILQDCEEYEIWLGANLYRYRTNGKAVLVMEGNNHAFERRVTSETIKSALAAITDLQIQLNAANRKVL